MNLLNSLKKSSALLASSRNIEPRVFLALDISVSVVPFGGGRVFRDQSLCNNRNFSFGSYTVKQHWIYIRETFQGIMHP